MRRRRRTGVLLPSFLCLAAAACSGGGGKPVGKLSCPATFAAPSLDRYTVFRAGGGTTTDDIVFGVKLATVKSSCKGEEGGGMRVTTALTFVIVRNDPELRQSDFAYFVAIADGQQHILAKQNFALRVDFAPRQKQMRVVEEITEHLPVSDVSTGGNYAVIIGLQPSQQQFDVDRQRQSLAQ